MKFLKLTVLIIGFQSLMFSQIKPGRYIIKLDANQKAIQLNGFDSFLLQETCAPNTFCDYQYWDVKAIRGQEKLYYIQSVQNKKCITFYESEGGRKITESIYLEPQKPLAQIRTQSFFIKEFTSGKYTIEPCRSSGELIKENDISIAANSQDININGNYLKFDKAISPSHSNVLFTFFPVVATSNVQVTQVAQTIKSPTVIVAPKSDNKLDIDLKTGNDNLDPKDFMEGLKITVKIKNKSDLVKENANEGREWPNNSIRRISFNLPADINCQDIQEVIISRIPKGGSANNITAIVGDNWNLNKVTITSRIKVDGVMKNATINWVSPSGSNVPLYRFVYENRDTNNTTGTSLSLKINGLCPAQSNVPNTSNSNTNASLTCVFGTGGDNLEGGNNNVNIKITFKNSTKVLNLNNVNNATKWNNFTENSITKALTNSADIDINDIKTVEIRHTGGGGMFADNWDVDKIKISITKNGVDKVLVDKIGTPIHRFTGDSRIKSFTVE